MAILKEKEKMAKERGLISPNDFAQLQKYMECESFSQPFTSEDLTPDYHSSFPFSATPLPRFPQRLCPSQPQRYAQTGERRERETGDARVSVLRPPSLNLDCLLQFQRRK